MHRLRRAMIAISAIALLPLAFVLLTIVLSTLLGCDVDESGTGSCVAFGRDWGELLSVLFSTGWLSLLTIPLLMGVYLVWGVIEGLVWWRGRRQLRRRNRETGA